MLPLLHAALGGTKAGGRPIWDGLDGDREAQQGNAARIERESEKVRERERRERERASEVGEREREEANGEARQGALPGLGAMAVVEKRGERGS